MSTEHPLDEQRRLAALDKYDVLDSPQEEVFDRITKLTRRVFGTAMANINLIDGHRTWFKSQDGGLPACEVPRSSTFCNIAIREASPLIVPDALDDERFRENPT